MKKFLILSTCILWYGGIFAQDKKVAVFDPAGDVNASIKEIVREEISNIIVNTRGYAVLERQLINKVLEENKFQMGGLVDNSQIGEIGKKMGANAVFVTSITPTGSNLYISFKLIDVQTARIEKQKTGRTTKGENDLDVVVQRIVNEMMGGASGAASAKEPQAASGLGSVKKMFGASDDTPAKGAQPARTVTATSRKPSHSDLVADGMDVFHKGRELKRQEVRNLLANTDALRIYNKGVSRRRAGNAMLWSGIGVATLGIGVLVLESMSEPESTSSTYNSYYNNPYERSETTYNSNNAGYYSSNDTGDSEMLSTVSSLCITTGSLLIVAGVTFKIVGKYTVKKAVNTYNNQYSSSLNYAPELQLGFTGNGVGLVYRF